MNIKNEAILFAYWLEEKSWFYCFRDEKTYSYTELYYFFKDDKGYTKNL